MKNKNGQTALILILLTAVALIFLAITLNWGRIAQTKVMLTIAADQGASLLASDVASYGEMQKQTYLNNTNQKKASNGIFMAIIMIVVAIIVTIVSWGSAFEIWGVVGATVLAAIAITMAVVNLVLQLTVVQPGITALWNKLQKNQPITQQFFEGGIAAGLQGTVTDQATITDYFDLNTNGLFGFGADGVTPNDTVSRFGLFYTERLKMLNTPPIPQVAFFYNQLNEFINGETCDQNESDAIAYPGVVSLNPACNALGSQYCINDPIDPACKEKIPNGFQLSDTCPDSNPASPTYNPYCDPCCQPLTVNGATVRPSTCADQSGTPGQCLVHNPYGSPYYFLYDSSYQNYAAGLSFLAQLGRDQPAGSGNSTLNPQGNFPNGVYPFFWLMNNYSPEVDNINPASLQASQLHWCANAGAPGAPSGFSDLAPLTLPYSCSGQNCCVNFLNNSVVNGTPSISAIVPYNGPIDLVGSPSFGPNPAQDPSFGEGGSGSWLQGDNQMCSSSWPYNGSDGSGGNFPDGTCEWTNNTSYPASSAPIANVSTVDNLDDTMHTLSDFVKFAQTFLGKDVGTLSSTFQSWYPQVAGWIAPGSNQCVDSYGGTSACSNGQCSDGSSCGSSANGSLLPLAANLSTWNNVISTWLNQSFTSSNATNATDWCVPTESSLLNGNNSTAEDSYIHNNSSTTWGDMSHVISCLTYNSGTQIYNGSTQTGSVYNYQQCLNFLNAGLSSGNCPVTMTGTPCDPSLLGRSLAGPAPTFTPGSSTSFYGTSIPNATGCDVTVPGSYANWVQTTATLAAAEAPKFALRASYLSDVYARAQTMLKIFPPAISALNSFLKPCGSSPTCADGGPAAQLTYAYSQPSSTASLPHSVIYGWVDTPRGGQQGYAHLVKVTAYSPGRGGPLGIGSLLPWIKTKSSFLSRSYTLTDRDGLVYISVKRWDEDHNPVLFPNGHVLWQSLFHKVNANTTSGQGLISACDGLVVGNSPIGFGLTPQTVGGLAYNNQLSGPDQKLLSNAFMLNDNVNGNVDPSSSSNPGGYTACLTQANQLLANAPESHMCAEYIASRNASGASGNGDSDYSLKFVSCAEQPDDLTAGE